MKKLIGYQVEKRMTRGDTPHDLWSFEVYQHAENAAAKISEQYNPKDWCILPVYEGDIEDYRIIEDAI